MLHWFTSFLLISEAQERGRNINLFYPQAWRADSDSRESIWVVHHLTISSDYLASKPENFITISPRIGSRD
jgi:hypothetical protein